MEAFEDGQPGGRHLQFKASFDRGQVVILAAEGLQREPAKTPCGVLAGGHSLPRSAGRDGVMVNKHISDD